MLAGPAVLSIQDNSGMANPYTSFTILNINNVWSVLLREEQFHIVEVPSAYNIVIAAFDRVWDGVDIRVSRNGATNSLGNSNAFLGSPPTESFSLSGPLQVEFVGPAPGAPPNPYHESQLFTYYLTKNTFEISDDGLIEASLDSFEVILEKSTNGAAGWAPIMIHEASGADKDASYRIRMTK